MAEFLAFLRYTRCQMWQMVANCQRIKPDKFMQKLSHRDENVKLKEERNILSGKKLRDS